MRQYHTHYTEIPWNLSAGFQFIGVYMVIFYVKCDTNLALVLQHNTFINHVRLCVWKIHLHVVRWVIQHADGGEQEGAHLISNAVTDEANEMRKIGVAKTYLQVKNRVSFKEEYNVEVKVL